MGRRTGSVAVNLEIGTKYRVEYRWKYSPKTKHNDFTGTYLGVHPSPAQGHLLHTFDIGGGATFYLGTERIVELEAL